MKDGGDDYLQGKKLYKKEEAVKTHEQHGAACSPHTTGSYGHVILLISWQGLNGDPCRLSGDTCSRGRGGSMNELNIYIPM